MDGTLNNQSKRSSTFDVSLHTAQPRTLSSVFHSTRQAVISLLGSRKKIVFVSAASLLTFSIPLALAVASDSPSRPANAHNEAATSSEGNNSQNGPALSPGSRSKTEVNLNQNTSNTSSGNTHSSSLTINGKSVPMPENGRTRHVVSNGQQTTNVDIESHSQQSASGGSVSNNSSSSVNIQSNSNQLGGE